MQEWVFFWRAKVNRLGILLFYSEFSHKLYFRSVWITRSIESWGKEQWDKVFLVLHSSSAYEIREGFILETDEESWFTTLPGFE